MTNFEPSISQENLHQIFDLNKVQNLRTAQTEGFFAVLAHRREKGRKIIVLPTGTGKTDLMIAIFAYGMYPGKLLVLAPSNRLRIQLKERFETLGCLVEKGVIAKDKAQNFLPKVVALTPKSKSEEWQKMVEASDVVVTTPMLIHKRQQTFMKIADKFACLFVDEGHHVAADIWREVLNFFPDEKILLFTATPYRNDQQNLGGKTIYTYSLKRAQEDGIYSTIELSPIFQLEPERSDRDIAVKAIEIFERDKQNGYEHKILARCDSISKAYDLKVLYQKVAPELAISVVTSREPAEVTSLNALEAQDIIICVDMFGEGVDCPAFKIAAIHSNKKSLGPLLQFIGRFVRTTSSSGKVLGPATMIFNQAEEAHNELLTRLYQEDSDWNFLIPKLADVVLLTEAKQREFIESIIPNPSFEEIAPIINELKIPLSYEILYVDKRVDNSAFFRDLQTYCSERGFYHFYQPQQNVFFIINSRESLPDWAPLSVLEEKRWEYTVIRFLKLNDKEFICISSSAQWSNNLSNWLKGITGYNFLNLSGESIFRIFSLLSWPVVKNVGGNKEGHRFSSFQNIASKDISLALLPTEQKAIKEKNAMIHGRKKDKPCSLGASQKGKVWALSRGGLHEWSEFVEETLEKIEDSSLDIMKVLEYSKYSSKITKLPSDVVPISIDFDASLYCGGAPVSILWGNTEFSLFEADLVSLSCKNGNSLTYQMLFDGHVADFSYTLGGSQGNEFFQITSTNSIARHLKFRTNISKAPLSAEDFFEKYPPHLLFSDCSILSGTDLLKYSSPIMEFASQSLLGKKWEGCELNEESQWEKGIYKPKSVQACFCEMIKGDFEIVFDDDGSGEIADLVCLKRTEGNQELEIHFFHLKYALNGKTTSGNLQQFNELASQTLRSRRWTEKKPEQLFRRMLDRNRDVPNSKRGTRFVKGDQKTLNALANFARSHKANFYISMVQPGLSKSLCLLKKSPNNVLQLLGSVSELVNKSTGNLLKVYCSE